jgi:histidyl-tRNA synthetase
MITKSPGTEDIFPDRIDRWNRIIDTARSQFALYNFKELITPVMEFTEVFSRGIGDETDIVSKEMFTLEDRGGRSLTLRPEGTAGVVRAYNENGEYNRLSIAKFFYIGPMFRAEKPQKGRLRQFNQFGAETFGSESPWHDFEIIALVDSISRSAGITEYELLINSIGCDDCRGNYIEDLKKYYTAHSGDLCADCRKRLAKNPLRLLDCKVEGCKALKDGSPKITGYLCAPCADHHRQVKEHLTVHTIPFTEDPFLVRGLDYYTRTTFEFVTSALGGQNAFAAGGRYDKLVEMLDGKPTPGVGFAAGIERIMIMTEKNPIPETRLDVWVVYAGDKPREKALSTVKELRAGGFSADIDPTGTGMKSQMKKAEREKSRYAVIIGDEELNGGFYSVKKLDSGEQLKVPIGELHSMLLK